MAKKRVAKKAPKKTTKMTAKKTSKTKKTAKKKPVKERPDCERRLRQSDRWARIMKVLELIQSRGRWNVRAIAAEVECRERTVYRDLAILQFAGIPWYYDKSECCYRVRPDFRFPVLGLTEDEALGQALATAVTRAPGLDVGPGAAATTRKLAARSASEVKEILADAAELIHVLDLKMADHSKHREIIKTVQYALLEGRQVTGHYESPYESGPVKVRLHPYRLCLIKNAWYLIAKSADEESPRTYRIARFKTLRYLDQPADMPDDFDIKEYFGNAWAVFRGDRSYNIEIRFDPKAAKIVTETNWHPTQKVTSHKNGSITLKFQVDGLEEIVNWLLGWAGLAKVVKPRELRDLFVERLQQALIMHGK